MSEDVFESHLIRYVFVCVPHDRRERVSVFVEHEVPTIALSKSPEPRMRPDCLLGITHLITIAVRICC